MDLEHAGGNYMTDGYGISASSSLVYEENNESDNQVDQIMEDYYGIHTYHVIDDPNGTYIDHIDCWGKYLSPHKVLIREVPTWHSQYDEIEDVVDYFENTTTSYGGPWEIFRVYTPSNQPYTNSLILNDKVIEKLAVSLTADQLEDPAQWPPTAEDAPSLVHKRKTRQTYTPIALAGDMSTSIVNTDNVSLYTKTSWHEPNPRYGGVEFSDFIYLDSIMENPVGSGNPGLTSQYPFNHVRMSESGHVEEWDDTPTAERLHRLHKSGTFEEIQPDGTKVTKIVGNEYEITLGYKDVTITGTCNVTIKGDCRMLYLGDLVQEVYGDYHLNVHKDMRTKIGGKGGNRVTEVRGDNKTVINGLDDLFVGESKIVNVGIDLTQTIGGKMDENVTGKVSCTYNDSLSFNVAQETVLICGSTIDLSLIHI